MILGTTGLRQPESGWFQHSTPNWFSFDQPSAVPPCETAATKYGATLRPPTRGRHNSRDQNTPAVSAGDDDAATCRRG